MYEYESRRTISFRGAKSLVDSRQLKTIHWLYNKKVFHCPTFYPAFAFILQNFSRANNIRYNSFLLEKLIASIAKFYIRKLKILFIQVFTSLSKKNYFCIFLYFLLVHCSKSGFQKFTTSKKQFLFEMTISSTYENNTVFFPQQLPFYYTLLQALILKPVKGKRKKENTCGIQNNNKYLQLIPLKVICNKDTNNQK